MQRKNSIALGIFVLFYISFGAYLTLNQERIVYQPFPQDFDSCAALPDAERVTFNGTRMYVYKTDKQTVILYHGNAGSACDRALYANLFSQAGYGYILVEYAGYSNDPLPPTHNRIKNDVRNVIAYTQTEEITSITLVGESLGTAVASYHTSLQAPEKLLLISAFTDLTDIAGDRFWFYPTSLMVDNAFDNVTALQNYTGATLFIHGGNDTLSPIKLATQLYGSLPSDKKFVTIPGAGHNNLFAHQETYDAIAAFLK